jgi:TolA-binding protein
MRYSMAVVAGLVLAGLVYTAQHAQAQSKEEKAIREVQRDVYSLQRAVEEAKQADETRYQQLEALIRQAVEATSALSAELGRISAAQKGVTDSLAEQQKSMSAPIAGMRSDLDAVSRDSGAVRTSVDALTSRVGRLEQQITELATLVRTINVAPPEPPPPAVGLGSNEGAEALYMAAQRDYGNARYDLALAGFGEFVIQYSQDPRAPEALYYMGLIYDSNMNYDDAVKAFDTVLERYGGVERAADAQFSKANSLMKANKRPEATREFQAFLDKYPSHASAATARARLRDLGVR